MGLSGDGIDGGWCNNSGTSSVNIYGRCRNQEETILIMTFFAFLDIIAPTKKKIISNYYTYHQWSLRRVVYTQSVLPERKKKTNRL